MIWRRRCVVFLAGCCLAACMGDPPSAPAISKAEPVFPPIARDRLGIAPTGGADFSFLRDGYVFNQRDPAWKDQQLGMSGDSVGDYGCTLTATAMASANLGHGTDPGRLNTALNAVEGYTPDGLLIWSAMSKVSKGAIIVDWHDTPTPEAIDACLVELGGHPIIQFQLVGGVMHWVVIVGKQGTRWLIRDPLISTRAPIELERRAGSIRAVRCIRPD